ncbi:MAG TPA: type VI secretion system Vgr family protein [Paraburkholderia sp.]|nr:type VI secretion system Vgr family protein [Paraburkholderia sp.]
MTTNTERFRTLEMRGCAIPERVRIGPGGIRLRESVFIPRRISGHEGVGCLFEYRVEAVTPRRDALPMVVDDDALDPGKFRGTEITLTIDLESVRDVLPGRFDTAAITMTGAGTREISGYVAEAAIVGVENDTTVYEFILRPWGWFAALGTNSRVFNGAILDILDKVLSAYRGAIEWRLNGAMNPSRDLIRQAWESDWDFCMRLCEEFGFVVWWEHRDGTHVLVIADHPVAWHRQGRACETLRFHAGDGHIHEEHITHLAYRSSITPGKVTVHDHSYLSPRLTRNSVHYREEWAAPYEGDALDYEAYTHADYAQPRTRQDVFQDDTSWHEDARELARVKLEAECGTRLRAQARGHLRGIEVGKTFTLMHHPYAAANREYVVLACTLDIHEAAVTSDMLRNYVVDASFDLHPTNEPYRMPQVTPQPCLRGTEYAVIVGPKDTEIWLDEHNRVLIQYAWDRDGQYDGRSSIWVRIAQPWQGDQMGTATHGRCGQQVYVGYVNGDPDRPYVAAFVPDRHNMPAWKLPGNHALSGMVSRSLGRGSTTNHLALDDTENRQQAQLASDHAKSTLSLGYIARIEGNAGRQDARGEGFELRTDKHGVLRAALGMLITTWARPGARGKVKDMSETVARLTGARDIHEGMAQQAQRHDAQDAMGDQAAVVAGMKRANAELRGKSDAGRDAFPEFEAPHLTISSAAGIQSTAAGSTHIASDEHTAFTAGGHVSIATGKSFFASVREKIAFYAQKAITLVTPGRIHVESRTADMRLLAQEGVEIISKGDWIRLASPKGIELHGGDSVLRISSEGIVGYTGGRFLVHAGDHATDNPVSKPVESPVTPENPGKLAAHHVLVEDGGGFAIANQPYRLTLDDGQVIQGVTNELGELQMVTSNVAAFGAIELMSQSTPEDVIGVTNVAVYADANRSLVPPASVPAKRTTTVGGKNASTPDESVTSQGKQPEYFSCDALNFGLRRYRFLKSATAEDTPLMYRRRTNIEYPVAKTYTAAVKTALEAIDWVGLAGGPPAVFYTTVASVVQPSLWAALQDGAFGLPADSISSGGSMPAVKIVGPEEYPKYGITRLYEGGFVSEYWTIAINKTRVDSIVRYAMPLANQSPKEKELEYARKNLSEELLKFAETLYHESRHCQQRHWMISLFSTYPGDYSKFKSLEVCYENTVEENALAFAKAARFPQDDLIKIGIHRVLVFDYYWRINGSAPKNNSKLAPILGDLEVVEQEVCKLLNVTPEVARLMGDHDKGYRSHLHEEDAFTCGEIVESYWRKPDDDFRVNPGTCTREYGDTLTAIGAKRNA